MLNSLGLGDRFPVKNRANTFIEIVDLDDNEVEYAKITDGNYNADAAQYKWEPTDSVIQLIEEICEIA